MIIGMLIYGSLDTVSGGYYYDRRLVASLQEYGDEVQITSIPQRNDTFQLSDNLSFHLPAGLDILIQDELCHAALIAANRLPHPYPIVSLVHHLRSLEEYPGLQNGLYRFIESMYLRSVDGFIFSSITTQQTVLALTGEEKPAIIANPPTDRFSQGASEDGIARRSMQPGPLRILFVGNVIPRKGLSTLITAISSLPAHSASLDVVGSLAADPLHAAKIQGQVKVLGLQGSITFHGILAGDGLQKRLEEAQVLVVPSFYEGFGIVYLEGMAFGLPAIATTAGAAREIINPGENGFLIHPGDAAGLGMILANLMKDRDLLTQLSRNALASYRQRLPWNQTAYRIRNFLVKMVG
jgi:glycosyltransferase involved in cell wall biosynthesis